eukprot:NODE_5_length_72347_cov_1.339331.p17 type:complete len:424 gc:universal NODE_5_length_72347_cov_1.339331:49164-50435(+)
MGTLFNGEILNIPFISVDYLTKSKNHLYFVSHAHSDHFQGLNSEVTIHCTRITAEFFHLKFNIPRSNLVALQGSQIINFGRKSLKVTVIDANHCYGSCMFYFEYLEHKILYTGDCRLDGEYLKLQRNFFSNLKVTEIYFDNTLAGRRFYELPTITESLISLTKFIKKQRKSTMFFIDYLYVGHEVLFEILFKKFNQKIHVDLEFMKMYQNIPCKLSNGFLSEVMTLNPLETKFHYCTSMRCARQFKIHKCAEGCPHENIVIRASVLTFRSSINFNERKFNQTLQLFEKELDSFQHNERKSCVVQIDSENSHNFNLLLSLHSSVLELDVFLRFFNLPSSKIYPIVKVSEYIQGPIKVNSHQHAYRFLTLETTLKSTTCNEVVQSTFPKIDNNQETLFEYIPSTFPEEDTKSDMLIEIKPAYFLK